MTTRPFWIPIRPLEPPDRAALAEALAQCGIFTDAEARCCRELADLALGGSPEYEFFAARLPQDPRPAGFLGIGEALFAEGALELYWLIVHPRARCAGLGGALMDRFDLLARERSMRLGLIETSSTPRYAAARRLYERNGYRPVARIADYYRLGDDRIVYRKDFAEGPPGNVPPAPGPA